MPITFKCEMCGAPFIVTEGANTVICEYCGHQQALPNMREEKMLRMYSRAENFRLNNEFDKAAGIYEYIVEDYPDEAAAYWGIVLCRYGISYVDDPLTQKKIPTCNRASYSSILDDMDYTLAVENANREASELYVKQAEELEGLRKKILDESSKEEPYDIFISYKEETEEGHERTIDSVMAQDMYQRLTNMGYRVFFSRITLREHELGRDYEPVIFSALNSAKLMLLFGTQESYMEAVWVKNEWSRYMSFMSSDPEKHLIICYREISPENFPKELRHLEAINLSAVGATQDLISSVGKIFGQSETNREPQINDAEALNMEINSRMEEAEAYLITKQWHEARECYEEILDVNPRLAEAYFGEVLCENECSNIVQLEDCLREKVSSIEEDEQNISDKMKNEISEVITEFIVPKEYLTEEKIREIIFKKGIYHTCLESAHNNLDIINSYFEKDVYMAHTLEFAQGEFKNQMLAIKQRLVDFCSQIIKTEEKNDMTHRQEAYERAINAVSLAKKQAEEERERDYQTYANVADDRDIEKAIRVLENMGCYKECEDKISRLKVLEKKLHEIGDGSQYVISRIAMDCPEKMNTYLQSFSVYEDRYERAVDSDSFFKNNITINLPIMQIILVVLAFRGWLLALFIVAFLVGFFAFRRVAEVEEKGLKIAIIIFVMCLFAIELVNGVSMVNAYQNMTTSTETSHSMYSRNSSKTALNNLLKIAEITWAGVVMVFWLIFGAMYLIPLWRLCNAEKAHDKKFMEVIRYGDGIMDELNVLWNNQIGRDCNFPICTIRYYLSDECGGATSNFSTADVLISQGFQIPDNCLGVFKNMP